MTGIANRRMFDSILDIEWTHARRNHQPLSLILLDIDFFKQYNDHYGHIKVDDCLKQVSQVLLGAATRSRDFLARFGGEEFVIVLPETNTHSAKKIADRCRQLVRKQKIPHEKSTVSPYVTISLGIGSIIPSPEINQIEFIEKVDSLLYKAKQKGRDCVESWQ